jgi:hypothetical protein
VVHIKRRKNDLLDNLDSLDKKAEHTLLSPQERDLKCCLNNCLAQLLWEEEVKWYQCAKSKNLLEGDMNTKYFQLLANGKYRKTRIYQLEDDMKIIEGDNDLKKYIITYDKDLFGSLQDTNLQLDESFWADIPQV